MKHCLRLLIIALFISLPVYAAPRELWGVLLPPSISLAQTKEQVILNGYAICSAWGEKAYVGALYTEEIEDKVLPLLLNDIPMAMVFYFVQDDISADMLKRMFSEGIFINNTQREEKRLSELQTCFTEDVNAGDVLAFHYSPQQGVLFLLNNKVVMHWPYGKSFFNMILRMWIGDYPPTCTFKQRILDLQKADAANA